MSKSESAEAVRDHFGADANRYDTRHYGSRYRTFIGDRQKLVNRVLRELSLPAGSRVLDVACGPGHFLHTAIAGGACAVGLDSSRDMLRTSGVRLGERARLVLGDGMVLPFEACSFDLVNCSGLIEYLPEPMAMLREFRRVLRPDGLAMVSSTNRRSPAVIFSPVVDAARRLAAFRRLVRLLRPSVDDFSLRERRFKMSFHTPAHLATLLRTAGFEGLEMHYCHLQLFPHPLDHLVPAVTTACVTLTDRLLRLRPTRAFAEGLLVVGRRPN